VDDARHDVLGDRRLVLVVDQLEELWTSATPADSARILDILIEATSDQRGRVLVVVCLRADYYGHAAQHPAFAALLTESQVLVSPMTTSEMRAAVERPALDAGLVLEPGLSQAVVDDVAGEPGALPLLSTAMAETWERRRGRSLTLAGYAETGGARRAIAGLAEATLSELSDEEQQVARRLLLRLAAPTAEGADVARPAPLAELHVDALTSRVLAHLAERRLVSVGESTARVAHEALLREWPRLRRWLEEDRDGRRLHQQIASAAVQWHEGGRDDGGLLRGARLGAADDWRAEHHGELTAIEREFLAASAEARQRELRAARRTTHRFQVLAGALVLLLVGVMAAGGLAVARGREASTRATEATARGLAAQAIALMGTRVDTALLLAVEGYRTDPSIDTETGVLSALEGARHVAAYRDDLSLDTVDLAATRDRRTLAVLTRAGDVRLLDATSLRPLGEPLVRGVDSPYVVEISPSGELVGYSDATGVHVVDRQTGQEVVPGLGGGTFASLSFSADGRAVAVAGGPEDPGITVTDLGTAERLGTIPDEGFGQAVLRPGADEVLVAREDAPMQRYRLDGTPIGGPLPVIGWLSPMLYTPDGSRLVHSSPGGAVRVYDAETFQMVGEAVASTGSRIVDMALSPDGTSMALSGDDGSVRVAAVEDGALIAAVEGLSGAYGVVFLDEQSLLASSEQQSVELDLGSYTAIGTTAPLREMVGHLAVLPDGETVLAGQGSELVEIHPDGSVVPTAVKLPVTVDGPLALSPDGTRVAVLGTPAGAHQQADADRQLVVADRRSGKVLVRTPVAGDEQTPLPGRLAFAPDGQRLAVGTFGGMLTVLDSTSGGVLVEKRVDEAAIGALRWSADGEVLYQGGQDGVLRFLDPATAEVQEEVPLTPGFALSDMAGVPDSELLAVASEAGEILIIDLLGRAVVGERLSAEGTQLLGVAVSPEGDRVAGVTRDGSLRMWHRHSGRLVGPALDGHRMQAFGIAWASSGQLVTGSPDGSIISWDTDPRDWSRVACRIAGRDLTAAEWQRYLPEQPYRRTCSSS
jgi:WD40 repeat protein